MYSLLIVLGVPTAIAAWCLGAPAASLACALGAIDRPGPRRVNPIPVPRLGGLAIFGALVCGVALAEAVLPRMRAAMQSSDWRMMALAATAVFAVGLADDLRSLGAALRLVVEAVAAIAVALFFAWPDAESKLWLAAISVAVDALWLVAISNGSNLIDGLDGLAAGVALIEIAALGVVAAATRQAIVLDALVLLFGAWSGFLLRNFHPARIFAGDGGALLAGFAIGAVALRTTRSFPRWTGLEVLFLIMAYPACELAVTVLRRFLRTAPERSRWRLRQAAAAVFVPDRDHIHHRLLALGLSHAAAVCVCYALSATMAALGVIVALRPAANLIAGAAAIAIALVFVRILGYGEFRPRTRASVSPPASPN